MYLTKRKKENVNRSHIFEITDIQASFSSDEYVALNWVSSLKLLKYYHFSAQENDRKWSSAGKLSDSVKPRTNIHIKSHQVSNQRRDTRTWTFCCRAVWKETVHHGASSWRSLSSEGTRLQTSFKWENHVPVYSLHSKNGTKYIFF